MRLSTFSTVIGVVLVIVGLSASALLIISTDRLEKTASDIQLAVEGVYAGQGLRALIYSHNRERLLTHLQGREIPERPTEEKERWYSEIDKYVSTEGEAHIVARVKRRVNRYLAEMERQTGDDPLEPVLKLAPYFNLAIYSLDELIELNRNQAEELRRIAAIESRWATIAGGILFIVIAVFTIGALTAVHRLIFVPVLDLKRAIEEYRQGAARNPCANATILEFQEIGAAFEDQSTLLAQRRRMQLNFIAGIAHDIRTPLNALQTALRLLKETKIDDEKREQVLGLASRQVTHLATLTKDLADTASIESGQLTLRKSNCNVAELVRSTIGLYLDSTDRHQFILEIPDASYAYCDPQRMTQVINNLMSNAVKYSPQGGVITVKLEEKDGYLVLSVSDQGIGISPEDLPKIFEPFRRTSSTVKSFQGMGLGLSVVKRIAEAHLGRIDVTSELGSGSTFRVTIPQKAEAAKEFQPPVLH